MGWLLCRFFGVHTWDGGRWIRSSAPVLLGSMSVGGEERRIWGHPQMVYIDSGCQYCGTRFRRETVE